MVIIDSQIHLYLPHSDEHPWPEEFRTRPRDQYEFLPSDLLPLMDGSGVDRAIVVPPVTSGYDNEPQLAWAAEYSDRFAVMGRFDLLDPDRARLERWRDRPGMLGCRFIGTPRSGDWLNLEESAWFWETAERCQIPVMMLVFEGRIPLVGPIAERYPDACIILDHCGTTLGDPSAIDMWAHLDDVLALARHPNVLAKLSALPLNTTEGYPFPSQTPYIRRVYDAFGPQRLAWGTDGSRLRRSTYKESVDHLLEAVDFLSPSDKEWIMGRTITTALRWPEGDVTS